MLHDAVQSTPAEPVIPRPGIQIAIDEPELQAYVQRHPFAGPEEKTNAVALRKIVAGIRLRPAGRYVQPTLLEAGETRLAPEEERRALELLERIGISADQRAIYLDDFGWEANMVPRCARKVLVVGCGDGVELIFLRAVLPEADIFALDYHRSLLPGLEEAVRLRFQAGDLNRLLPSLKREYDLVYSNHTMEHLFDPDGTLATLAGLLVPGSSILSAMPMCAQPGMPFLQDLQAFVKRAGTGTVEIDPIDAAYFDVGHPWKTNPDDVTATLEHAGFSDVRLYQRRGHLTRPLNMSDELYVKKRERAVALHRIFWTPLKAVARRITPRPLRDKMARCIYAAERRLPFGTNSVMNLFSEEVLFVASYNA